jgi:transcriptional regulator with XRE-family HTH domain
MIKNDRQYHLTRSQLHRFQALLEDLRSRPLNTDGELRRSVEIAAVQAQVTELTAQLEEYDALREGRAPVGRLESLDQLPELLLRARIAAGFSHRDLAERLGLKEQQVQRYEANDWRTANLARLIEVAGVLGIHLDADVALSAHALDLPRLTRQLERAGLDRAFLERRLVPPEFDLSVTADDDQLAPVLDLTARINRIYGWTPSEVLRGERVDMTIPMPAAAGFKMPKRINERRFRAYTAYARYLASLVLQATASRPTRVIPASATDFRAEVVNRFGRVSFEAVLAFVWELGIPVLPLSDPAAFHAAVWRTNGRNVVVLKQQTRRPSRWLFDLLHEVDHANDVPALREHAVIDTEDNNPTDPEARANAFAADVVLNGRAEELVMACVQAARGSVEALKRVVPHVAQDADVDLGVLANYLAYRLSLQPERPGSAKRINWWPTATNLQPPGPDPWVVARDHFLTAVDLDALSPVDRSLLTQALSD